MSNPNGKKGGDLHQILQNELFEQLQNEIQYDGEGKLVIRKEVQIATYEGKKESRVADIAAFISHKIFKPTKIMWLRIIQIGRTDKKGEPTAREKQAIADIEQATGIDVEFFDYKTKNQIK